NIRCITITRN
ncbi:hypothetical protein KM1_258610, partial [Entamoeba histolytica HM-3:IMSS]